MNVDQDLMCKFITFKGDARKNAKGKVGAKKQKQNYFWAQMKYNYFIKLIDD